MRQAGRYMPEYRALRERYGILELIKQPELACEVTLQPINAFDLDAAIIFADILPPLEGMGLSLEFVKGEGPLIHNPIRTAADIERCATPAPEESLAFTLEAIRLARTRARPPRHPADRLQRRALHPGLLRHRGRRQPAPRPRQAVHDGRPGRPGMP